MGLFGFGKQVMPAPVPVPAAHEVTLDLNKGGILNLNKNEFLNLTKADVRVEDIRVAAGWDVVERGTDYDLDLCAIMLGANMRPVKGKDNVCYYGHMRVPGLHLLGDNLTGAGDGDDETIEIDLGKVSQEVHFIKFCVVIYKASVRHQSFGRVKNAFCRLVDNKTDKEICRFNLTEDGGKNTAIVFAEISRDGNAWNFKAIGDYYKASIQDLRDMYAMGEIM